MDETFPPPFRLPGQPEPPREVPEERRHSPPKIVDEPIDAYFAEAAAAALAELLAHVRSSTVRSSTVRVAHDGLDLLAPPFTPGRDRVDGPQWARSTLVVFGTHGHRRHAWSGACWPPFAPAIPPPWRSRGATSPTRPPTRGRGPRAGRRGGRRAGALFGP